MNIMKRYILIIIVSLFAVQLFAQDETVKEKDTPVTETFNSGYIIDDQTVFVPDAKTLEFAIQHKFGSLEKGISNLYGIYGSSNIRLALNYVPLKKLQIGAGVTKNNMYTDFNAKWLVLNQTENNSIPVSVALYGVAAIDGRNADIIGTGQVVDTKGEALSNEVSLGDRFSYFSQIIIGRKFTDWLSLQAGASFSHYNMVKWEADHDKVGLHFNGRVKFSPQSSIIFNYNQPLKIKSISEQDEWTAANDPLPNVSIGWEISTYTHVFQIYLGTADGMLPQDNLMFNRNDWLDKGLRFGFNITRLWMY
jgi:hypothetical protein